MAKTRKTRTPRPTAPAPPLAAESGADVHWFFAGLMAAAVVGILIYLPMSWVFDMKTPDFNPLVLAPLFLGAVGLFHLFQAVRKTMRARKFGAVTLSLTGASVVRMGGRLEGVVRTASRITPTGDVRVVLQCVDTHVFRQIDSSSADTETHREHVTWEHALLVPAEGLDSVAGIPFAFELPASVGEPPTPEAEQGSATEPQVSFKAALSIPFMKSRVWTHNAPPTSRRWRLVVAAPTPGTDVHAEFPVQADGR